MVMKTILIVTHTYSNGGGAERVLHTLVGELSKWYKIDIIERWEDCSCVFELPDNVRRLKSMTYFPHFVEEKGWNKILWSLHRNLLSLLTIVFPSLVYRHYIKGKYDIEVSFNYLYPALLIVNSPNKHSKKIAWNHGDLFDLDYKKFNGFQRIKQWVKFEIEKEALKKVDSVVAISHNTYHSICQLFPFAQERLSIISNGYDLSQIAIKSKEESVPASSRFRLIFLGRLDYNKNVISQIKAVNTILNDGKLDVEFLIYGQGEEEQKLKAAAGRYLDKNIFFRGFSANPYPQLKSSNALLMTSYSEGFPTVLIESICLGVPVIATRVGGVDEIVKDGVNGIIVENNVNDIAEKIRYMANHYEQFENHIEETVSHFSAKNWGNEVKKLIESL